jgi:hypothetical protein
MPEGHEARRSRPPAFAPVLRREIRPGAVARGAEVSRDPVQWHPRVRRRAPEPPQPRAGGSGHPRHGPRLGASDAGPPPGHRRQVARVDLAAVGHELVAGTDVLPAAYRRVPVDPMDLFVTSWRSSRWRRAGGSNPSGALCSASKARWGTSTGPPSPSPPSPGGSSSSSQSGTSTTASSSTSSAGTAWRRSSSTSCDPRSGGRSTPASTSRRRPAGTSSGPSRTSPAPCAAAARW